MPDAVSPILQWLNIHPHYAGLVTFLISGGESVAIIGTIVPGTVTMTALGTLIGAGVIPLWSTFIWAIFGAIAGDNLSYWTGRYFKDRLRFVWPFRSHPLWLQNGEAFFFKHGSMSILIGRFIGPIRAIVPIVAGMLGMKPLRFIIASIIASSAWAPLYMLPGILLGEATLELPPDIAARMVLVLLLTGLFIILCTWLLYKFVVMIKNQVNQFFTHMAMAFYVAATAIAFSYLALYLNYHASNTLALNNAVFHVFRGIRTPSMDSIMLTLTLLGEKNVLVPTALIVCAFLAWRHHLWTATHALGLVVLTCLSVTVFKHVIHSERPWGILLSPNGYSFPSGHATLSLAFYVGFSLLIVRAARCRRTTFMYIALSLFIAAIGISRLYLGAHWFTDVLGGWLLSSTLLMLVALSYPRRAETPINVGELISVALLTLCAATSLMAYTHFYRLQHNHMQLNWPTHTTTLQAWWNQKGNNLPLYRIGRAGLPTETLNLQWIGNLQDIKTVLLAEGWTVPPEQGWTDILQRLTDVSSAEHLPLVDPLYFDHKPALVLIKNIDGKKKIIVLRLWASNIILQDAQSLPLWVGCVGTIPRTYSWLINYKNNKEVTLSPTLLFTTVPKQYDIQERTVTNQLLRKHVLQTLLFIKPKTIS